MSAVQRRMQIASFRSSDARVLVDLVKFCDEHDAHMDFLTMVDRDHSMLMAMAQLIVEERKAAQ